MRLVATAKAASVVMPSKQLPGPSPYIGTKWSNPQTPSKPRASANRARANDLVELHALLSDVQS